MSWLYLGITSGLILGLYDLFKKASVRDNAVLPVLLLSNLASALVWLPFMLWSYISPDTIPNEMLLVGKPTLLEHGFLVVKTCIVGVSWLLGYFALKNLPISIASTISATRPVYTLVGALILFQETPSVGQWSGILVTMVFFFGLSVVGRLEGIKFENNKWVWLVIGGTLAGAFSGLWDKFMLNTQGMKVATVQAWFSVYLVFFMLIPFWGWFRNWWPRSAFQWRWSIPAIGLALLAADFCYFTALSEPDAMVSVISCLRRGSVLISFSVGTYLYREKLFWKKLPCVMGILGGILIIVFS